MDDLTTRLRASAVPAVRTPRLDALADAAGLLDVAYVEHDSPVGRLTLAATPRGLIRIGYGEPDVVLAVLAARVSPRVLRAPARLDEPRRQLDAYFAGGRRDFELELDWRLTAGFGRRILRATRRISFGAVSTYAGVAGAAGSPRAYRAAGNALGANPLPIVIPCHRVLATGGGLGGYTGGTERKRVLLALEGVEPWQAG